MDLPKLRNQHGPVGQSAKLGAHATPFDAMPVAMAESTPGPVWTVPGTVKVVEPVVPDAMDMVL